MNRGLLGGFAVLLSLFVIADNSYGWYQYPEARIVDWYKVVCIGQTVNFDAEGSLNDQTGSYDPDNGSPYGGGHGIDHYDWSFPPGASETSSSGGHASCKFNSPGTYHVWVEVTDDDPYPLTSSEYSLVRVVKVDKVVKDVEGPPDEGPLYVLPGSSVALQALPDPIYSSFPSGKPIWVIQSYPDGANPSLSQNSGPTTTLSNLTVPGIYNVSAYCGNSDAISVVVVKVELQYCFPDILMYTGSHAQNTPTQNCVAIGKPSGGTFSWQCSTKGGGSGLLGIVNTVNSDPISTVTVKGAAPSSISNDAKITVSYTFDAKTIATADGYVTVHRPSVAASYSGYFDWQNRTTRHYFHPIGDQFGGLLYITGIPCDEVVTCIYGLDENVTSPGATAMHPAEKAPTYPWGNWNGGIAVKDTLGAPTAKMPNSAYRQELYAGGWHVATYTIYMQPLEDNPWPCIWKE